MDLPVVLKTHVPKCKKCCADIDQLTAVPTPSRKRGCAPRITYHAPTKRQVVGRAGDLARVLPTYLVDIRSHICRMGHHRVYINYHSPLFARRAQCLRRRSGVHRVSLALVITNHRRMAPIHQIAIPFDFIKRWTRLTPLLISLTQVPNQAKPKISPESLPFISHNPNSMQHGWTSTLHLQYTIMHDSFHGSNLSSLCQMHSGSSVSGTITMIQLTPGLSGGIGIPKVVML